MNSIKAPAIKGFAPVEKNMLFINQVAESEEDAMLYHTGVPGIECIPVVVVPDDLDQIADSTLQSVATAICAFGEEDPASASKINPGQKRWEDYLDLARAAMLGLQEAAL